jgi:hypothetical protein
MSKQTLRAAAGTKMDSRLSKSIPATIQKSTARDAAAASPSKMSQ